MKAKNISLIEIINNTVTKNRKEWLAVRESKTEPALIRQECLACLAEINGYEKKVNTLTCSTICGLWLQSKIYQAETEEQAKILFQELGLDFADDPNQLDEYFQLEFKDPLGQFSTSRLIYEINKSS